MENGVLLSIPTTTQVQPILTKTWQHLKPQAVYSCPLRTTALRPMSTNPTLPRQRIFRSSGARGKISSNNH